MKTFLDEVAADIYKKHRLKLDEVTVVFPNRRAILYFRKYLSDMLDKPAFSPKLYTIEDFIASHVTLKVPDKLELVHRLHEVYHQITSPQGQSAESFDQFFFWGDMLLRDFEEVDKYMVDAPFLFKDLSNQKELDATFDFLTPEQVEFLKSFWINFDEKDSVNKGKFLKLWRQLPEIYEAFRNNLAGSGLAYEGMVQRMVAERFKAGEIKTQPRQQPHILFAGFNALTKSEEVIISSLVDQAVAEVYWDIDAYYFNNNTQEAGKFFREYENQSSLKKTFLKDIPANFLKHMKGENATAAVHLYGTSQTVGQAKAAAAVVEKILASGGVPEETVVVLPDEKMLMPVLHSVTGAVEKLNVTMGFPLGATPLFNMIELLIDLQLLKKDGEFNHRPVTALLAHPYVVAADPAPARAKTKEILNQSWVSIPKNFLATTVDLHRLIFQEVGAEQGGSMIRNLIGYLREIITELGSLRALTDIDLEYCYHFLKLVNRMEEVIGNLREEEKTTRTGKQELKSFLRLFRQLVRAEKIPFTGEPLKGLQIMGVLETRNLDFKNVLILSLNEGAFPSFASRGSYVPHNIRRAYGLPTADFQDAMYAYLFYRVLQRAQNVYLFYTTETDDLGEGEMSRYLQQLLYESGVKSERHVLHNPLKPLPTETITVTKDERVFQSLGRYIAGSTDSKSLSPTALNDYIECRLKFYFKYVAGIREAREVEDDLDARILGNFLHKVMEKFYLDLIDQKEGTRLVTADDLRQRISIIESLIDQEFVRAYKLNPDKPVLYEGQRVVVKEVVKRFAEEILKKDIDYAPFEIVGLETRERTYSIRLPHEGNAEVLLSGSVDRADQKGNVIRVIDYKTGKDDISFDGPVGDLVNRDAPKRNKAAFQTMMYALLFQKNAKSSEEHVRLVPGLMNRVNLFEDNFSFGLKWNREWLNDATPLLGEFDERLKELVAEIYDPAVPFNQTENSDICKWCPYHEICCR